MKVLIKIKENIKIKDLINKSFALYKRSNQKSEPFTYKGKEYYLEDSHYSTGIYYYNEEKNASGFISYRKKYILDFCDGAYKYYLSQGCAKRNYIQGNIGIQFIRDNSDLVTMDYYGYEKMNTKTYWKQMLEKIKEKSSLIPLEVRAELFSANKDIDESYEIEDEKEDEKEYETLLKKDSFYLMDNKENIYYLANNKLNLIVKELYFVVVNNEIILSNEIDTLKEYLVPIYKINEGTYEFNCNLEPLKILDEIQESSNLVFKPKIEKRVEETKFYSGSMSKNKYDISFEDFLDYLEFTSYQKLVTIYKCQKSLINDKCDDIDYHKKHKENNDIYKGYAKNIRYINKSDLVSVENELDSYLLFNYVKKVDTLVIDALPSKDGVLILNETVLKIILEMLYNVTDLNNIKEIYLSNNIIGAVAISEAVLKKFPSLKTSRQYELTLKTEEDLTKIYNDEKARKDALNLKQKKERRIMVTTINANKNKFNEALMLKANNAVSFDDSVMIKKSNNGEYTIINRKYDTREHNSQIHYRSTHIIEAPKIINLDEDNIYLNGFVISFPNGVEQIVGLKNNKGIGGNDMNFSLKKYYDLARQGTIEKEKFLFIILPKTLDMAKFEFFTHLYFGHLIFISDDLNFIRQFNYYKEQYNKNCPKDEFFNAPIVYDKDIYEKIWGYRINSNILYKDLEAKIKIEFEKIKRDIKANANYRFFVKKEFEYIPDDINIEDFKNYINSLSSEELITLRTGGYLEQENLVQLLINHIKERGIIKEKIIQDIFSDYELGSAVNGNNLSSVSKSTFKKLYSKYYYYFKTFSDFLKYFSKIFMELVMTKTYYDIPEMQPIQELHYLKWGSEYFDSYKYTRARMPFHNFYVIANVMMQSDVLVNAINGEIIPEDYSDINKELNKLDFDHCIILILYVFHILKTSGYYFEIDGKIDETLFNNLVSNNLYNKDMYNLLVQIYIRGFNNNMKLSLNRN